MPTPDQLGTILTVLARFPQGIALRELLEQVELSTLSKRTLQRRLEDLLKAGKIHSEGAGRGFKYLPIREKSSPQYTVLREDPREFTTPSRDTPKEDWLTPASKALRARVSRPLPERGSKPYDGALLAAYEPNVTEYVPPLLRQELTAMGKVGMEQHPAGTYLRKVMDRLIIDLSWNSSRLEGNTYSILETQRLFDLGEGAEGKSLAEAQMILNHKGAIEILADQTDEIGFNRYTLFNLHAALSEGLLPYEEAAGRLRHEPVGVTGTSYKPLQDPTVIEENFDRFLEKAEGIRDPFEQAFFAMVHLPYLQPFIDVNKRVSRLIANIPLMHHNLCPLSFIGVPREDYILATLAVYEECRIDYLRDIFRSAYQKSCDRYSELRQVLGEPDPFRVRYRHDLHRYIRHIIGKRMDKRSAIRWINDESNREIDEESRARFIEMVEMNLSALHEGNIARYRVRPGEFHEWQQIWR